jgi:hypothetical protein
LRIMPDGKGVLDLCNTGAHALAGRCEGSPAHFNSIAERAVLTSLRLHFGSARGSLICAKTAWAYRTWLDARYHCRLLLRIARHTNKARARFAAGVYEPQKR